MATFIEEVDRMVEALEQQVKALLLAKHVHEQNGKNGIPTMVIWKDTAIKVPGEHEPHVAANKVAVAAPKAARAPHGSITGAIMARLKRGPATCAEIARAAGIKSTEVSGYLYRKPELKRTGKRGSYKYSLK